MNLNTDLKNNSDPELTIAVAEKKINRINYSNSFDLIRTEEKKLLSDRTKLESKNIIFLNQVHEDRIISVDSKPEQDKLSFAEADGIITPLNLICPIIRSADCVPVFACDIKNKILGAVHSGWRGSRLSIAKKLITLMKKKYGSEPEMIKAYILPSIGPESYKINQDVANFFPKDIHIKDGNIYLDLWKNIENTLIETGIQKKNIFNSKICTLINQNNYFTHRGGDKGRNLNYAFMR